MKGKKDLAVNNQGVIYYFSSVENKEDFKKNPSLMNRNMAAAVLMPWGPMGKG